MSKKIINVVVSSKGSPLNLTNLQHTPDSANDTASLVYAGCFGYYIDDIIYNELLDNDSFIINFMGVDIILHKNGILGNVIHFSASVITEIDNQTIFGLYGCEVYPNIIKLYMTGQQPNE